MQLLLPKSLAEIQSLEQAASAARSRGRLYAIQEESLHNGVLSLRAKLSDPMGFVDHPRLTVLRSPEILLHFQCDCPEYRRTRDLCPHCIALAMDRFGSLAPLTDTKTSAAEPLAPAIPPVPAELQAPSVDEISYAFSNSRQDLYPGKLYPQIPLNRYYQMYGTTALARMLYSRNRHWGGSCFGITTTASMFFVPDDPVTAPDFRVGAVYPRDLLTTSRSKELHMTLHTFIEGMHILQLGSPLIARPRSEQIRSPNCLDELCRRVLHFQQTRRDPVGMAVWQSSKFNGGHSVFPYWLETLADGQDRLHIYDPNHPMKTRYAYLEKDADGHYTNWRFPMSDHTEYSSATGGQLSFDAYAGYKQAWDARGGETSVAMMSVPRKVAIASTDGKLLFRVTEEGTESFCDDIYQVIVTDLDDEADDQVMLNLPAGNYLVRSEDLQRKTLQVMMTHVQQSISVTTSAPEVEILADDASMTVSARIAQADCAYFMNLDAIYGYEGETWAIAPHLCPIELSGITAEGGLTFGCFSGTLRSEGTLTEKMTQLRIDDQPKDLSFIEKVPLFRKAPILNGQDPLPCTDQPEIE